MSIRFMMILIFTFFIIFLFSLEARPIYQLTLANGVVYTGHIHKKNSDGSVLFSSNDGMEYSFQKKEILELRKMDEKMGISKRNLINDIPQRGNIGLGYGIPYGNMGIGIDCFIINNLAATLGLGVFYGNDLDVGARYFFRNSNKTFRPKITLLYGKNRNIKINSAWNGKDNDVNCYGVTVGTGGLVSFGHRKRTSLDFDAIYIITSIDELNQTVDTKDKLNRLGFSVGYRFNF
jgi:hypothetical protein